MARKTEEKKRLLDEKIHELEGVLSALYLMKGAEDQGLSEKTVLDALGIDYAKFRHAVYQVDWAADQRCADQVPSVIGKFKDATPTMCWQEDLWCDAMGVNAKNTSLASVPADVQETVEIALETLTEREKKALIMYYRDGMEWEEIGTVFGVGRERVRQIMLKAMRKMRHPSRLNYLYLGNRGYISLKKAQENLQKDFEVRMRAKMVDHMSDYISGAFEREFAIAKESVLRGLRKPYENLKGDNTTVMDLTIEELDLSIRSYNCLKRAGLNTVNDICQLSADDLLHIRNLGKRSYDEIKRKLNSLGIFAAACFFDAEVEEKE